jgi:hypothetical protein
MTIVHLDGKLLRRQSVPRTDEDPNPARVVSLAANYVPRNGTDPALYDGAWRAQFLVNAISILFAADMSGAQLQWLRPNLQPNDLISPDKLFVYFYFSETPVAYAIRERNRSVISEMSCSR